MTAETAPGAAVHVGSEEVAAGERIGLFSVGWLVVVIFGLVAVPKAAWVAVLLGAALHWLSPVMVPFVLAMIDLPEGVRLMGNVTDADPDRAARAAASASIGSTKTSSPAAWSARKSASPYAGAI